MNSLTTSLLNHVTEQREILRQWAEHAAALDEFWEDEIAAQVANKMQPITASSMARAAKVAASNNFGNYLAARTVGYLGGGNFAVATAKTVAALDDSETQIIAADTFGYVLDLTDTALGHDMLLVGNPRVRGQELADKQRVRDNLARLDFYDRYGRMTQVRVSKLSIPTLQAPDPNMSLDDLALLFLSVQWKTYVLLSMEDRDDAMLYRLALN